jgi:hypothetical protein
LGGDYNKDSINSFQVFTQAKHPDATQITTPYYLIKLGWLLDEDSGTFITEDGQKIKTHGLFVKLNDEGLVVKEHNFKPKVISPKDPNQEDNKDNEQEECKGGEGFCNMLMSRLPKLRFKQSKKSIKKSVKKSVKKSMKKKAQKKSVKKSLKKSKKSVKKSMKKKSMKKKSMKKKSMKKKSQKKSVKKSGKKSMKKKSGKKTGKKSQKKKVNNLK